MEPPTSWKRRLQMFFRANIWKTIPIFTTSRISRSSRQKRLTNKDRVVDYIKRLGNPIGVDTDGQSIRNVATGQSHSLVYKSKLTCITLGNELYSEYKEERLDKKTASIFDTLKHTENVAADFILKNEMSSVQKYLHYADIRNFDLKELLTYEITKVPFFLFTETGFFKKSQKADLTHSHCRCRVQLCCRPAYLGVCTS